MNPYLFATSVTRKILDGKTNPEPSPHNGKPYRNAAQKAEAKRNCYRCKDGSYASSAPVSWHAAPRGRTEN